jgi:hypothetical protein
MRFHNCTGSYIFESHADWLSKSKWFFFFVFLFTTRWESVGHCKSIKKGEETGFYPTHTKKKMNKLYAPGFYLFYGVGWRSVEWSDRRWWPTVGWYVRMSGSRVTCRSFTMAAPFVRPVSTVTTSDVVEQPFRRNRKETSERERERVKPFPYATHNKWWRPDAFFFVVVLLMFFLARRGDNTVEGSIFYANGPTAMRETHVFQNE